MKQTHILNLSVN